jgi:2'-5' RNA ligase
MLLRVEPTDMSGTYSIWFGPDRETQAYRRLNELIGEYARSYPDAPDFDPHITLLGGIETDEPTVVDRTQDLARGRDPLELAFGDASCSTTTHQCVFLLVVPSTALLELRRAASEAFDRDERLYVPHLSLIYSGMDIDDRVRAVQSIDADSVPDSVRVDTIEVVDTSGPVSEWRTVSAQSL